MQLETGSGKTVLSFVIACNAYTKGLKVLLINFSEELTFRDFKKAHACSWELEIPVNFLQNDGEELRLTDGITFLSFRIFARISKRDGAIDTLKTLLLIDEVDSVLFQTPNDFEGL